MTNRLTPDELRTLFLFEALGDEQLRWLAERGEVRAWPAGSDITVQGEPAEYFLILLSGTIALYRLVRGDQVEITRTDQRGSYTGATRAYVRDGDMAGRYAGTSRAITDTEFFVMQAEDFATFMRQWFPIAIHLLEGLFFGITNSEALVGQRERLSALGSLTAGLMHELNNPAAATARAAATLRERIAGMRHKLGLLADARLDPAQLVALTQLQESVIERASKAPKLTALQASDAEDEVGDWLEGHGVEGAWNMAQVFVAGGLDLDCLEEIAGKVDAGLLDKSLHWIAYALETEQLMTDIEDASARISSLVAKTKQYSQLDRAPHQWIDVHDGLDSTLVMLSSKIGPGIRVVKEYDRSLPQVPAYPAELNQVWTNLIDNAVQAMAGTGTLTVRTSRDTDRAVVEIGDTGPGVPEDLRQRVFEPFFTTKPVGEGTGLGLDISRRIVVNRHRGDLTLVSGPGDTRFQVRLPLAEPAAR
ncbi:MAG TPA: ATP-binding protein [Rugosimonospora sp.]|nr:ATP-binding protein [Rugosimonospora sp.]